MIGSGVGSYFGSGGGGGGSSNTGAGVGQTPYSVISHPTFPWSAPMLQTSSEFISKGLQDLTSGEVPTWWKKYQQPVREGMQRGVEQAYYGGQGMGGRGVIPTASDVGSITGVGPKATQANVNKALVDYANKMSQIDEYLAGKTLEFGSEQSKTLPYMAAMQPQGPPVTVSGGQMYNIPASEDAWSGVWGGLGQMFGNQDWMSMLTKMLGNNNTAGSTPWFPSTYSTNLSTGNYGTDMGGTDFSSMLDNYSYNLGNGYFG